MFKLVISDDEGKTTVVPLVRDEVTIGRKEGNTIRLTERNVSRRHARFRRWNGAFVIEDLGSYNGVKINGDRIEGEVTLEAGDTLSIGDYELAIQKEVPESRAYPTSDSVPISVSDLLEPVPPARLVMLTAPAPGAEYALTRETMRIGRSEKLDIWVNHRSISREHASFVREGDAFVLRDLDSANGVRVNGSDLTEVKLKSGDILELGQVRFRFVGEGETYVFDAEDARAVEAILFEKEASRAPIMAAVVIIVIAIAVGAAITLSGGGAPTAPPEVVPPPIFEEATQSASGHRALAAFGLGSDREMHEGSSGPSLGARSRSNDGEAPREVEPTGPSADEGGRAADLGLAREALARAPSEAAQQALTVEGGSARGSHEAPVVARAARRGGAPSAPRAAEQPSLDTRFASPNMRSNAATRRATPTTRRRAPAADATEALGPLERARDCLGAGDHRCVVRALEGRTANASGLGLLIESYLALGDHSSAIRHMRSFVSRYPEDRRAERYRRFLDTLR